jgi:tRNA(Ile2) C34 agmatinyltransferase TiaS
MDYSDMERDDDVARCTECDGEGRSMGFLGMLQWFRCRACGMEFSAQAEGTGERHDDE